MLARPNGKKKILEPSVNSKTIKIKPSMLHRVGLKIYSIINYLSFLKVERIVSRLPNELVTSVGKIIVLAEGEDAKALIAST